MTAPKEHWQINTARIAKLIQDAAARSVTEEDLKMKVEPILQDAMKQMGLDTTRVRYEKTSTIYGGRRDSVYGYLTIEYKKPSLLKARKDSSQLQKYLRADAENLRPHRAAAPAGDGGFAERDREGRFVMEVLH